MIRGLKIVMIVWAALGILFGLGFIFFPSQLGDMMGYEKGPASTLYILESFGISIIVGSVFIIIAAVRDPLKHIMWVQYAILTALLSLAAALYSFIRGFVTFQQVGVDIILFAVFAAAFLALYPYRAAKQ